MGGRAAFRCLWESATEGEDEGVCSPARTARIIAVRLRGLTQARGGSVQPVGCLGFILTSSEDPLPVTIPLLHHPSFPRVRAVFEAVHGLGIRRHRRLHSGSA
jgi:hypothetical protein